jgi:hypothetical protein
MAIKNLQFVVTMAVDVPDDYECPTYGTDHIESLVGGVLYNNQHELVPMLEVKSIESVDVQFETITD